MKVEVRSLDAILSSELYQICIYNIYINLTILGSLEGCCTSSYITLFLTSAVTVYDEMWLQGGYLEVDNMVYE